MQEPVNKEHERRKEALRIGYLNANPVQEWKEELGL